MGARIEAKEVVKIVEGMIVAGSVHVATMVAWMI